MVLMRRELGDVLREERQAQRRSLRDVCAEAALSPGYLSEIERGEKEASSELLMAVCDALGMPLSTVLREVAVRVERAEVLAAPLALPVPQRAAVTVSAA
ncbi:MAG TPA: helix-turn-helix transcriptional regulator [Dermatophilaceae bacterium]|nr:helix-turn-helix transcriptional regulator [Dermatophilaceae bacterium]